MHATNLLSILSVMVQHNWGNLYDYSITWKIFTSTTNRIFIQAPQSIRIVVIGMNWIC